MMNLFRRMSPVGKAIVVLVAGLTLLILFIFLSLILASPELIALFREFIGQITIVMVIVGLIFALFNLWLVQRIRKSRKENARIRQIQTGLLTPEPDNFRQNYPEWIRQLPLFELQDHDPNFTIITIEEARKKLTAANIDPNAIKQIEDDLEFLNQELVRLFRDRDHEAKLQQNRYRLYQIGYMTLATLATLTGALLAISLQDAPHLVAWFGFFETAIALTTTYLATISGREQPLQEWLLNRRRAEYLRREYFRYLMDLEPYDIVDGYERRRLLSLRAAHINRGSLDNNETPPPLALKNQNKASNETQNIPLTAPATSENTPSSADSVG